MALSRYEKMVLAFSTKADDTQTCSGTLFQILSQDEKQYYKLRLIDRNSLEFVFRLRTEQPEVVHKIDASNIDFCDSSRHIVNIERTVNNKILHRIDGRKIAGRDYNLQLNDANFVKPYNYYVGNTKILDDPFVGCISGAKFHLFTAEDVMQTVEPIAQGIRSKTNSTCKYFAMVVCARKFFTFAQ